MERMVQHYWLIIGLQGTAYGNFLGLIIGHDSISYFWVFVHGDPSDALLPRPQPSD
jgi:hypothetical protein